MDTSTITNETKIRFKVQAMDNVGFTFETVTISSYLIINSVDQTDDTPTDGSMNSSSSSESNNPTLPLNFAAILLSLTMLYLIPVKRTINSK